MKVTSPKCVSVILRCMSRPPSFPVIFTKGNNFCEFQFAFLDNVVFSK